MIEWHVPAWRWADVAAGFALGVWCGWVVALWLVWAWGSPWCERR